MDDLINIKDKSIISVNTNSELDASKGISHCSCIASDRTSGTRLQKCNPQNIYGTPFYANSVTFKKKYVGHRCNDSVTNSAVVSVNRTSVLYEAESAQIN